LDTPISPYCFAVLLRLDVSLSTFLMSRFSSWNSISQQPLETSSIWRSRHAPYLSIAARSSGVSPTCPNAVSSLLPGIVGLGIPCESALNDRATPTAGSGREDPNLRKQEPPTRNHELHDDNIILDCFFLHCIEGASDLGAHTRVLQIPYSVWRITITSF